MTTEITDCIRTKGVFQPVLRVLISGQHELLINGNSRGIQDVWLIEFVSSNKLLLY